MDDNYQVVVHKDTFEIFTQRQLVLFRFFSEKQAKWLSTATQGKMEWVLLKNTWFYWCTVYI